jgi:hypothetical protein
MQVNNYLLLYKKAQCASMQLNLGDCTTLLLLSLYLGGEKVHKFLSGLKLMLKKYNLCLVDPSHQNQVWAGCEFDKSVTFDLTMEYSLSSISAPSAQRRTLADLAKPLAQQLHRPFGIAR